MLLLRLCVYPFFHHVRRPTENSCPRHSHCEQGDGGSEKFLLASRVENFRQFFHFHFVFYFNSTGSHDHVFFSSSFVWWWTRTQTFHDNCVFLRQSLGSSIIRQLTSLQLAALLCVVKMQKLPGGVCLFPPLLLFLEPRLLQTKTTNTTSSEITFSAIQRHLSH